eukprot:EG_transcript_20184
MGPLHSLSADRRGEVNLFSCDCAGGWEGPFDLHVEVVDVSAGDGHRPEVVMVEVTVGGQHVTLTGKLQDGTYQWTCEGTAPSFRVANVHIDTLGLRLLGPEQSIHGLRLLRLGLVEGGTVPVDVLVGKHTVRLRLGLAEPRPTSHPDPAAAAAAEGGSAVANVTTAASARRGDRDSVAESTLGPASEPPPLAPNGSPAEPWPRSSWEITGPQHHLSTIA